MVPSSAVLTPKNARGRPVTKLCLALEAFRRTDEGRIRDAKAFLTHFFPQDKSGAKDRIFVHMPNEVRADLLSNWGIRGKKSALRDDDDRVRMTVNDALNAGDIDAPVIEEGITPEILTDWVPLEDWWTFWRGAVLPLGSVRKALALARDLSLFDERWFLEHLALKTQKLTGTDVICAALSKEQIVAWVGAVHASGDASPNGLVAALGWETILAKTAHEGLLFALDALARQIGLAETSPEDRKSEAPRPTTDPPTAPASIPSPPPVPSEPPPPEPEAAPPEPPPTPRMDVPARISARPPEPATPPPDPVIAKPAPLPTPPGAVTKAESLPPPPPQKSASLPPPPAKIEPLPQPAAAKAEPSKPAPPPVSAKPPVPISTKAPESSQPAVSKPPPIPTSTKQAPAVSKPPPIPAAAKQQPAVSKAPAEPPKPPPAPPPVPTNSNAISKPPARPPSSVAPAVQDLPSVIIEDDPFFPPPPQAAPAVSSQVPQAPASNPPNARSLFLGAAAEPPPMRPPAATIVGVGPQAGMFGATDDVAMPTFSVPPVDPDWAPPKAEPGDMGWDLVHGVTRPMGTNVQPRYNFDDDDEPTSEIDLPTDVVRRR